MKTQAIEKFYVVNDKQLETINGGVVGTIVAAGGAVMAGFQFAHWLGQMQAESDYNRTHR